MAESPRFFPRSKRMLLILALALLAIGQAWASAIHWLRLPATSFNNLYGTICSAVAPACTTVSYPFYFYAIFPILLLALLLLVPALRRTALRVTHEVEWTSFTPLVRAGRGRILTGVLAAAALIASILGAISALMAKNRYPDPLIWLIALLLWGATFYSMDRANRRAMPLSRREIRYLIAYLLLLIVLGFVYHLPILQAVVTRVIFVLLTALIALAWWRIRWISGVAVVFALIASAGTALYTYNMTSWRYASIGDEYAFYGNAVRIVEGLAQPNPLDSRGVYNLNPVFANYIHAGGLAIYGIDYYSWRYSDIVLIFLTAPAIYALVRRLKGSGAGLVAVIAFLGAHPVIALAHIGYNNPEVLPGFAAMLIFALLALERRSTLAMFLAAVAAATTLYTYGVAFPLIPIPLLMLTIWAFWPTRELALRDRLLAATLLGGVFLIGLWAAAFPRALNTLWIGDAAYKSVFHSEMQGLTSPLLQQILPNTIYTLGASVYFDARSHYTSGAHLDPISSVLMLVGIAGLIAVAARRRIALWLLLSFLIATFVTGGLQPYAYPANTHVFLLNVFYAVFVALGAAYLYEAARDLGVRWSIGGLRAGFTLIALAVVALNAYQFFFLSPLDVPESYMAMIVGQFQSAAANVTFYNVAQAPQEKDLMNVAAANGIDFSRFKLITNPTPVDALMQIRQIATAPYRVVIVPDMLNTQAWLDAAKEVWPDHPLQPVYDDAGVPELQALDVPN
ncbi:MAG TPA: glycosyltransferase family 39 protein [Phototrophicaceae bacterium]|nr:glycosyltransferase family 39 protein [Phototrophicaceae bacterium]